MKSHKITSVLFGLFLISNSILPAQTSLKPGIPVEVPTEITGAIGAVMAEIKKSGHEVPAEVVFEVDEHGNAKNQVITWWALELDNDNLPITRQEKKDGIVRKHEKGTIGVLRDGRLFLKQEIERDSEASGYNDYVLIYLNSTGVLLGYEDVLHYPGRIDSHTCEINPKNTRGWEGNFGEKSDKICGDIFQAIEYSDDSKPFADIVRKVLEKLEKQDLKLGVCTWPPLSGMCEYSVGSRAGYHGLLNQPKKQHPTTIRKTSIEAKNKLVQIGAELLAGDGPLVHTQ